MALMFRNVVKRAIFVFAVILILNDPAICAEQIFYSIQFATLKNLSDVNKQVNSLKEKGKMVFWEKTETTGMGQFYRVYIGRYQNWDDAVAFRDKLKSEGVAGHLGIQWFSETVEPEEEPEPPKLIMSRKPAFVPPSYSTPAKDRFVDNKDGTVTDTKTNLMWLKNGWAMEFISALPWLEAMDKVNNFKHANYRDWRLPTIEEWYSLIDTNNQNPAMVAPNPFENIISHMPYWSKTEFVYSQTRTCVQSCPLEAYTVLLYSGSVRHQKKTDRAFIMPVRAIAAQKVHNK